jgi:hypothetical protein
VEGTALIVSAVFLCSECLVEDLQGRFCGCVFGGEVSADFFSGGFVDYGGERVGILFGRLANGADGAEVFEETLAGSGAYAGDLEEFGAAVAHLAALAVVGDGEAVGFVADLLDEVEDGGAAVEDNGIVFLSVDVDDLFALGDGGEGLGGDA